MSCKSFYIDDVMQNICFESEHQRFFLHFLAYWTDNIGIYQKDKVSYVYRLYLCMHIIGELN